MGHAEKHTHPETTNFETKTTQGELKPEADHRTSPTSVQTREPEDAYLTGGQRNLQRRVLGLNVNGKQGVPTTHESPGLHSTGSFTGVATGENNARKPAEKPFEEKK